MLAYDLSLQLDDGSFDASEKYFTQKTTELTGRTQRFLLEVTFRK